MEESMAPVKKWKDVNYFHKFHVETTEFKMLANWNFNSVGIALMIESDDPTDVVQYSFDGETVHGDMTPKMPSEAIIFDNRSQSKIWFRRATPGGPVLTRVEAWRNEQ
jgi:hypothetical protein